MSSLFTFFYFLMFWNRLLHILTSVDSPPAVLVESAVVMGSLAQGTNTNRTELMEEGVMAIMMQGKTNFTLLLSYLSPAYKGTILFYITHWFGNILALPPTPLPYVSGSANCLSLLNLPFRYEVIPQSFFIPENLVVFSLWISAT